MSHVSSKCGLCVKTRKCGLCVKTLQAVANALMNIAKFPCYVGTQSIRTHFMHGTVL